MRRYPIVLAVTLCAAVGCSSGDAFSATTDNMLGNYAARTFTTTDTLRTIDWLQRGGSLTITLGAIGTMTGTLFLPGAAPGGGDLDQVLLGNWTLSGNTITFDMPTIDTFIRDMPWTAGNGRLSGDHTFAGGTRIRVVLTK